MVEWPVAERRLCIIYWIRGGTQCWAWLGRGKNIICKIHSKNGGNFPFKVTIEGVFLLEFYELCLKCLTTERPNCAGGCPPRVCCWCLDLFSPFIIERRGHSGASANQWTVWCNLLQQGMLVLFDLNHTLTGCPNSMWNVFVSPHP